MQAMVCSCPFCMKGEKNMEEVKKVNTEHFKKKIGNTTYRVRVHFPQNTKRTFTDSVNTLIMNECTSKKK